jgi:hypothetical protein
MELPDPTPPEQGTTAMCKLLTLALAAVLICLTTLYPTRASACSQQTMVLIQQTYGTSNIQEDAFGNVTVLDAYGTPIALVREVNGFAFTQRLNGFYSSPGSAFIDGGPLNSVGLGIDARFFNRGFPNRGRFGFELDGVNGFNGLQDNLSLVETERLAREQALLNQTGFNGLNGNLGLLEEERLARLNGLGFNGVGLNGLGFRGLGLNGVGLGLNVGLGALEVARLARERALLNRGAFLGTRFLGHR